MVNKAVVANWVTALRSGNYQQVSDYLYDECEDGYCCLGVLCKVAGAEFTEYDTGEYEEDWTGSRLSEETLKILNRPVKDGVNLAANDDEILSQEFMDSIGIPDDMASHLISMNDGMYLPGTDVYKRYTFSEIADYIEENLLKNG